jgi:23S rRNA (cytidine1920-2'-O)/16S rRNA (cytidine1409-2'-O)-methyltransferase
MPKKRLDQLLVDRQLVDSREQAQRYIRSGWVRINEQVASKPGHLFAEDVTIDLKQKEAYVSRGGLKLEKAYKYFALNCSDKTIMDIGSSTGGFTDFMLQHGAARVYAVDCGTYQLHLSLREDPRVIVLENTNARYLTQEHIAEPIDLCTIDTSFISLKKILPAIVPFLKHDAEIISLIKPQFEASRADIKKGGVVKDSAVHDRIIDEIQTFGEQELDLQWIGVTPSPIRGPAGNIEFLAYWKTH